jgi:ketosteroid isomerase-like protein
MTTADDHDAIRAVLDRAVEAMNAGDADGLRACVSERPDGVVIGTDPGEWGSNQQMADDTGGADGGVTAHNDHMDVHTHGDVAWVEGRAHFADTAGRECPARVTSVLVREQGGWKIVQTHASIGVRTRKCSGSASGLGPHTGHLTDQVVALGDVRCPAGGLGVRGGGGRKVAAELVQVAADGVPPVPLAEHLAQPVGLAQPRGGAEDVADRDRAPEHRRSRHRWQGGQKVETNRFRQWLPELGHHRSARAAVGGPELHGGVSCAAGAHEIAYPAHLQYRAVLTGR